MKPHFYPILLFLCSALLLAQVKQISGLEKLYAQLNDIVKHIILQAHKEALSVAANSPNTLPDITARLQSILENNSNLNMNSEPKVKSHVNAANRDLTQQVTHCINSSCTIVHQKQADDNGGQEKYHFHINGPIYVLHDSKHMPKLLKEMVNTEKLTNDIKISTHENVKLPNDKK